MDKRYICENCGYRWESKKKFGEPSICPKCKKDNITKYSGTEKHKKDIILENEKRERNKREIRELEQQLKEKRQKLEKKYNLKGKKKISKIFSILALISFIGCFYSLYLILIFAATSILWLYYHNSIDKCKLKINEEIDDSQYELLLLQEEEYENEK